jgi:hydroxypyruvate isomerase
MLFSTGVLAAGASIGTARASAETSETGGRAVTRGRLRQSVCLWCFEKHWDLQQTCRIAAELGCRSVELVEPQHWPVLKKHGLVCALTPAHMFIRGMNNPAHWDECLEKLRSGIDASAAAGFPNVITFTGLADTTAHGGSKVDPDEGIRNCVEGYKKVIGQAEKAGVNICLEMLNSRVDKHMIGVPGYQGDHTEYCVEIIRRVGSPRMKLLFDIFHVQIMDGDLIRRIREYKDLIAHVHVAGNPGRGELDETQEINYPAVMKALAEVGYQGYVGQEFIPTGDPLAGLRQAVVACDV